MQNLSRFVFSKAKYSESQPLAKFEAQLLRAVIDFEVRQNRKNEFWSLASGGFDDICRDFRLLIDYHLGAHRKIFGDLINDYRGFFIPEEEEKKILAEAPAGKGEEALQSTLRSRVEPIWFFCLFLCRFLMERENPLRPLDAFWLGLIDEVVGADLPTVRKGFETPPTGQEELHFQNRWEESST